VIRENYLLPPSLHLHQQGASKIETALNQKQEVND